MLVLDQVKKSILKNKDYLTPFKFIGCKYSRSGRLVVGLWLFSLVTEKWYFIK